jgi:hypothetical protein
MKSSELLMRLPPFSDEEKTITDALVTYGAWITEDKDAKEYLTLENIKEIDNIVRDLIKSYDYFLTGRISECYNKVFELIFSNSYSSNIFCSYQVEKETFLFRMRSKDDEYLFLKEELFHVPFQERQKTTNQRFSLTGYPCLYLGRSIYVCWEELNRPKFDNANISGIKNIRPLELLDLRMPTEIKETVDFYRIPLIIASSVNVKNPDLPFKPEYVISQALLHAIIVHNNSSLSPRNFNGIIYYSSKVSSSQRLFYDLELFENIVVPTVNNTIDRTAEKMYHNGFCPILCNTFQISNPVSLNTYQNSKDLKSIIIYGKSEKNTSYSKTQMAILEEYIKSLDSHKIKSNNFMQHRPNLLKYY